MPIPFFAAGRTIPRQLVLGAPGGGRAGSRLSGSPLPNPFLSDADFSIRVTHRSNTKWTLECYLPNSFSLLGLNQNLNPKLKVQNKPMIPRSHSSRAFKQFPASWVIENYWGKDFFVCLFSCSFFFQRFGGNSTKSASAYFRLWEGDIKLNSEYV